MRAKITALFLASAALLLGACSGKGLPVMPALSTQGAMRSVPTVQGQVPSRSVRAAVIRQPRVHRTDTITEPPILKTPVSYPVSTPYDPT